MFVPDMSRFRGSFVVRRQRGRRGVHARRSGDTYHHVLEEYETLPNDASITYGKSVFVWCDYGHTVGGIAGGLDHYDLLC